MVDAIVDVSGAEGGVQSEKAATERVAGVGPELDVGLAVLPSLMSGACVEAFDVEVLVMGEHEVDGAPDASGEDAERLALAVTTLEPVEMGLAAWVVLQEEDRGLTEGPLQGKRPAYPGVVRGGGELTPGRLRSGQRLGGRGRGERPISGRERFGLAVVGQQLVEPIVWPLAIRQGVW